MRNGRSRRDVLKACSAALAAAPAVHSSPAGTGIRVERTALRYEDYAYRTPIKFGGSVVDRVTLLNVECVVRTADGRTATGFGSMPMGNVWSFPSQVLSYDQTLTAMKALAGWIAALTGDFPEYGHPLDLNLALEPAYLKAAREAGAELRLAEPIPKLCTLVTASPFDAAIHDGFGKLHGRSTYKTYGADLLPADLSRYLGPEYRGMRLDRFVSARPKASLPLYHLVGAVGYTGAALKACKGQSQAVLMAAAGQAHRMFLCVQDLTCPGASLVHSAGLAAHISAVAAIEANARQYVPVANKAWEKRFPGLFIIKDGRMRTAELKGSGLGAV